MPNPISYECRGRTGYLFRFKRPDTGKRTSLRLGVVAKKVANDFGYQIDAILECLRFDTDFSPALENWLGRLGDEDYDRLARCGLVLPRETVEQPILGSFLSRYYELKTGGDGRSGGWKPGTANNRRQSMAHLNAYFGDDQPLSAIGGGDVEDWYRWLVTPPPKGRGLAASTAAKALKDARQFFDYARRKQLIAANPFEEVKSRSQDNPDRLREVPVKTVLQVIDLIEDREFRAVVALARFAGLRIPSELQRLQWGDVAFEKRLLHIQSPKTEHHRDSGRRICPLFDSVRPYLEALRPDSAHPNDFVFHRLRDQGKNLRTQFVRYIRRAGLEPWPKPFQNLRANALTDLADEHPIHTVCKWLGNTPDVAQRHYLIIKKRHYELPQQSSREPSDIA